MNPELEIYRPEITGKTAVVTGGSSGIGSEICATLGQLGATVHFCGRNEKSGRETEARCAGNGRFARVDVTDANQLKDWVASVPVVDFLVNNVADDRRVPMDVMDAADFDASIAVNLRPHFVATLAALPAIRRGVGKSIVMVGTCNYMAPEPDCLLYNAGKAGIAGIARSLARQLGPEFIRVNTFTPGWIATEKQLNNHLTPDAQQKLKGWQSLPKILSPRDVMGPLLFLLSRAASSVTGQNLLAEGGRIML
ncbi:MAG: SDR family oxidoreductase [Kiritimatiellaeota bacterium]|nr:SDR family oxidoreductase [Kiritimatiellota bacterium]